MLKAKATKIDRYFGKCRIQGCKTRHVTGGAFITGSHEVIFYGGHNEKVLRDAGIWCDAHNTWLVFNQLKGRVNRDKECNGVCMAGVGPSCDCACGGENHGKNRI
jgi:hypothetical protein